MECILEELNTNIIIIQEVKQNFQAAFYKAGCMYDQNWRHQDVADPESNYLGLLVPHMVIYYQPFVNQQPCDC